MTATPPSTPPPPPAAARRTRLLGPSFWALIIFSLVCVGAGVAVAVYGPKMLSGVTARVRAVRLTPAPPRLFAPPARPSAPVPPPAAAASDAASDTARRLARLQEAETRLADAATAESALAALADSARGSAPFPHALPPLEARPALAAELAALRPLAQTGAPSRAALAASFPDYAARATGAGAAPGPDARFLEHVRYGLSRIVSVRRVGDVPGDGLDAKLARAERLAADGEVEAALKQLDALPPAARDALAPWRMQAERRAEVDRRIAALRVWALAAPPAGEAP